ncbi:spore gernimation protein [Priestia megaterium]|uniref:GerAB/ArcD/ProY family transporter n=1 Tax=Priestia TaxID=2800373 RepID=UPI000BEE5866|nr:GerAB/ArcD/ProY family transporter [Priestia megaterium]MEB2272704.1 spore germination protein [Bacillus sp. ILBB4]MED3975206.1 GerAB/ArcD/ProY family transporter [Priestia megaterium]MED4794573.1 GerAB/ArcD/ProY family transporter [Priestia megaterium]PEB62352.1 spore gernimation protein [Priestia megaterium]PEE74931.1 spore gernimation protein [Priestia megaterium]
MEQSQSQSSKLLSDFYAISIISSTMLGVGLLTLPSSITNQTNNADGWIVLIMDGLLFIGIVLFLVWMVKYFTISCMFDFSQEVTGKLIGNIFNFAIVVYFTSVASFEVRAMAEMIHFYLLETMPIELIILSFILTGVYLITGGIDSIGKVMALCFPVTVIILLILYLLSIGMVDLKNLQPVLADGFSPLLSAFTTVSVSFLGIETIVFLPKHMKNKNHLRKVSIIGFSIPLLLYIITYVLVVGALSVPEVKTTVWPTIEFVQTHEVKGIFFERLELFLLIVWLLQFFLTFVMYFFLAVSGFKKIFKNRSTTNIIFLVPVLFMSSLAPKTASDVSNYSTVLGWAFLVTFLVIPLFFSMLMKIKKVVFK